MIIVLPCKPLFTAEEAHERYHPNYDFIGGNDLKQSISRRLEQLERTNRVPFRDVLLLIENNRYYDTLTDAEKRRFCAFIGMTQAEVEAESREVLGDLHFALTGITQGESRKGNNK